MEMQKQEGHNYKVSLQPEISNFLNDNSFMASISSMKIL